MSAARRAAAQRRFVEAMRGAEVRVTSPLGTDIRFRIGGWPVNGGYVRWNFFTDTTVTVGGDVWVRDGRLVR